MSVVLCLSLSVETEAKLLLWWHKVLESLSRQLVYGTQPLVVGRLVQQFLTSLTPLAQDRTTAGLLGAIGFGRKSLLSLRYVGECHSSLSGMWAQVTTPSLSLSRSHNVFLLPSLPPFLPSSLSISV